MSRTKHMAKRMSQRNIDDTMINLVTQFGDYSLDGDKIILNKKSLESIEINFRNYLKAINYMKSKGGLVCIEADNVQITSYFLNSFKKAKVNGQ